MPGTLQVTRDDLIIHVGEWLGFGRNPLIYSGDTLARIDRAIESGERNFYSPPVLPGETVSHDWSFLKPLLTLQLVSSQPDYELPEDYGGMLGATLEFTSNSTTWLPLKLVGVGEILRNRSSSVTTGTQPECAAECPVPNDGVQTQRYQLMVWPTPRSSYSVRGQYYSNPYGIAATTPYPMGDQAHGETLIEACLAAAELHLKKEPGPHNQKFMERLLASVAIDREQHNPKHLGSMNRSLWSSQTPGGRMSNHYVTVGGSLYLGAD